MTHTDHRYRLAYDDTDLPEYIYAATPCEAVASRRHARLPYAVTDLTQLAAWREGRAGREGIHTTPILDREYGTREDG